MRFIGNLLWLVPLDRIGGRDVYLRGPEPIR